MSDRYMPEVIRECPLCGPFADRDGSGVCPLGHEPDEGGDVELW